MLEVGNNISVDKRSRYTSLQNLLWQFLLAIYKFQLTAGFLKDLDGDKVHVLVLFFLYVLQARLKY